MEEQTVNDTAGGRRIGIPVSPSTVVGLLLIGFGVLFLLIQLLKVDLWEYGWPFFIIVPGLTVFALALVLRGRIGELLAMIGSMMTVNGLILLDQNLSGHWETWAYAWALIFPTSVGAGQVAYGLLGGTRKQVLLGARVAGVGFAIFLLGALFFEGVINISGRGFGLAGRIVFPALLIAAGVFLLVRNHRRAVDLPTVPPADPPPYF